MKLNLMRVNLGPGRLKYFCAATASGSSPKDFSGHYLRWRFLWRLLGCWFRFGRWFVLLEEEQTILGFPSYVGQTDTPLLSNLDGIRNMNSV